jgi:K+-transporting ATPase c subunit
VQKLLAILLTRSAFYIASPSLYLSIFLPSSSNPKGFKLLTFNFLTMSILRETITGIRTTFILWLLTALIYPFLLIAIGQFIFPNQANGSLITNTQGNIIGSALVGQNFTSDRYFFSRPSTSNYSTGDDAKPTGVNVLKLNLTLDALN